MSSENSSTDAYRRFGSLASAFRMTVSRSPSMKRRPPVPVTTVLGRSGSCSQTIRSISTRERPEVR